jgi:hypothetical protein
LNKGGGFRRLPGDYCVVVFGGSSLVASAPGCLVGPVGAHEMRVCVSRFV